MKSAVSRQVRKSAAEIPPASPADLYRLRAAMHRAVDTSEIAERRGFHRVQRDANGKMPPRKSVIRDAVATQMRRRQLTVYRLWQLAQVHYPPLSQAAVHEFLKGKRQLELPSIEALLAAMNLRLVQKNAAPKRKPTSIPRQRQRKSVSH